MVRFGAFIGRELQPQMLDLMQQQKQPGMELELGQAVFSGRAAGTMQLHGPKPIDQALRWNEATFSEFDHGNTALYQWLHPLFLTTHSESANAGVDLVFASCVELIYSRIAFSSPLSLQLPK